MRRVVVKGARGVTVFEVPLTIGLVGVALAPLWVAISAVATIAADCTIKIERKDPAAS